MENKLAYQSLVPHIKNLRVGGLLPVDKRLPKAWQYLHTLFRIIVFSLIFFYTMQQVMKVYQVRASINKAMDTMFLFLTHTDFIYKEIVIWTNIPQIEELLEITKGTIFNKGKPEHDQVLRNNIRQVTIYLWTIVIAAVMTCFLWVLYPIIWYEQGKTVEFSIWLPFDANTKFWYVVIYSWIITTWLAITNTTIDCFVSCFFAQCKAQLSILRGDLEGLVEVCMQERSSTNARFDDVFHRHFKDIVEHHRQIVIFADKIQNVFGAPTLYQFLASGWIICFAASRAVFLNPGSIDFISMIMYILCILGEVFLYCYFGNEVTNESELLLKSAYEMDWLQIPAKQRRYLIIFMVRIQKPIQPMAGVIIPLSKSTFVSVVRSSFSFYAFLDNTR